MEKFNKFTVTFFGDFSEKDVLDFERKCAEIVKPSSDFQHDGILSYCGGVVNGDVTAGVEIHTDDLKDYRRTRTVLKTLFDFLISELT